MTLPKYPSTFRNRKPILSVIRKYLPSHGHIIETASATGEHIIYFAEKYPNLFWHPSDKIPDMFWAIKKRSNLLSNVTEPIIVDLMSINDIQITVKFNMLININMIHISPWEACIGLFKLSNKIISNDGLIYLYGPFKENKKKLEMSNKKFDLQLRSRNSKWGIRCLNDVINVGEEYGFRFINKYEMPANNLSIIFKKCSITSEI